MKADEQKSYSAKLDLSAVACTERVLQFFTVSKILLIQYQSADLHNCRASAAECHASINTLRK